MPNEIMKATRFAPRNCLERSASKSTIGDGARRSMRMNATREATLSASSPRIAGEPQPQPFPSTSANTSAVRETVIATMPGMSTRRSTVSSRDSSAANSVTITAPTATGRLMKKIARQETSSVSQPPTTGPIASAIAETPAQVPIAFPRSCGGNALEMIERVAGIMNAAPIPWIAREATSAPSLGARPMVAEASAKTTTPNRNILRRPKMSPSRPPVTSSTAKVSVYALTVHSSEDRDASKLFWIDGRATFTAVLSSMIMKSAKLMAPRVHQRRLPSERRSRSVMRR